MAIAQRDSQLVADPERTPGIGAPEPAVAGSACEGHDQGGERARLSAAGRALRNPASPASNRAHRPRSCQARDRGSQTGQHQPSKTTTGCNRSMIRKRSVNVSTGRSISAEICSWVRRLARSVAINEVFHPDESVQTPNSWDARVRVGGACLRHDQHDELHHRSDAGDPPGGRRRARAANARLRDRQASGRRGRRWPSQCRRVPDAAQFGPPLHVHHAEDELLQILEGRVRIVCGDTDAVVGAGGFAYLPRGVPHTFWVQGDEPARMLAVFTPAAAKGSSRARESRPTASSCPTATERPPTVSKR